jgi:putative transposase
MPNYRRDYAKGGVYFFTVVTHQRQKIMLEESFRTALRLSIQDVRKHLPFTVDAWVLLPDHLHCIWTLPEGDDDFSERWSQIKSGVTRRVGELYFDPNKLSKSRERRKESTIWQRRFWEHRVRDERDLARHMDYVHYNPVKHGLVQKPSEWPYSTFALCVRKGLYEPEWGEAVLFEQPYWKQVEM